MPLTRLLPQIYNCLDYRLPEGTARFGFTHTHIYGIQIEYSTLAVKLGRGRIICGSDDYLRAVNRQSAQRFLRSAHRDGTSVGHCRFSL